MKKLFLIFMMFSIFLLIGCGKNTENKKELLENTSREKSEVIYNSTECKSNMKLWINKTYNFSICISKELGAISLFTGIKLELYDDTEIIGTNNNKFIISLNGNVQNYFGKYDKRNKFGDKEIIEHYFYDPCYGVVDYFKVSDIPQWINLTGFGYLRVSL